MAEYSRKRLSPVERFWAQTEKQVDGCWLWQGCVAGQGYGVIRVGGERPKAHRFAYEMLVGPIPDGLQLDHLCRVRHCVNPAHLEPVTNRENILRGIGPSAVHAKVTHCPRGHAYDAENTYLNPYRGTRTCRICRRVQIRAFKARAREQRQAAAA